MIEIEQNKPHKNRVGTQVLWKGKQLPASFDGTRRVTVKQHGH
jgi:hypothetical protein